MKRLVRGAIERTVRGAFGVDVYPDAFERLAVLDHASRLNGLFQHKLPDELSRHPLLFIHVPKNGGTSLKRALYAFDPGHATLRYYDWLAPALRPSKTSFALLREPIDRFLSGYDFLRNGGGSDVSIQPAALRRLAGIGTVDAYLDHLESLDGNWFGVDSFARPQWWYVADRAGVVAVDHLWIIGEQALEIAALLGRHDLPAPRHVNRTRREQRTLTAGQAARVERLFHTDFLLYDAVSRTPGAGREALAAITVPQVSSRAPRSAFSRSGSAR